MIARSYKKLVLFNLICDAINSLAWPYSILQYFTFNFFIIVCFLFISPVSGPNINNKIEKYKIYHKESSYKIDLPCLIC